MITLVVGAGDESIELCVGPPGFSSYHRTFEHPGKRIRDLVLMRKEHQRGSNGFPFAIMTRGLDSYSKLARDVYSFKEDIESEGGGYSEDREERLLFLEKEITRFGMDAGVWKTIPPWYGSLTSPLSNITTEMRKRLGVRRPIPA